MATTNHLESDKSNQKLDVGFGFLCLKLKQSLPDKSLALLEAGILNAITVLLPTSNFANLAIQCPWQNLTSYRHEVWPKGINSIGPTVVQAESHL